MSVLGNAFDQLHDLSDLYPFKAYLLRDAPPVSHSTTVRSATLYLCVLYLSENKKRLVPLIA